ncbi:MAG: flavodoxin family protein [Candidatus Heimdallarchaeota archaeon]|nr:flavodoxin family protein [Candidatus Heimdallarchaeota archaeon]
MNTIVLHGSPRKKGNSSTLAEYFLNGLQETRQVEVKHFYTNEMNIKHCQGCESCATTENNKCIIEDDMHEIYDAFAKAEVIVWASSMFWGYLTSQLKTALDRMEALVMNPMKNLVGKTFVVILTYRNHYETAAAFFKRIAPHFNIDLHILECCTKDKQSGKDIPVTSIPEKLEQAFQLGKTLAIK